MLRVLAVLDYFLPGGNAGGPVRTLTNLVRQLAGEVDFAVLTRDRDFGERAPYAGVVRDAWTAWDGLPVRYLPPAEMGTGGLRRALASRPYDVLYLNSAFSPFTRRILGLRLLGRLPDRPVIVAPRGELSPGPLAMKRGRKAAFLAFARAAGLFRGVLWQATSEMERGEILAVFPGARVEVAPNPSLPSGRFAEGPPPKRAGEARFVFLSRVSPKKNLEAAVRAVAASPGPAVLHVYGNMEDRAYGERCLAAAGPLPPHVSVEYRGAVAYEAVDGTLAGYHFFVLPTRGENFGHAVVEAMRAGLPVLVSDRTPWRGLAAARAGWDVPLDDEAALAAAVARAVEMDAAEYAAWSAGARAYAARAASADEARDAALRLFRGALAGGDGARGRTIDAAAAAAGAG
jgi:glycosyltransferase involved in cell wall biosynthesis